MDVRQLKYFVEIAASGSFSRAAASLNVAQPALSQHVANMEAELGVPLLFRSTRGVSLTEPGETLLAHAKIILRQVDDATRAVKSHAETPVGMVAVGLPSSASLAMAVPLLEATANDFPEINLKVVENHSGYLMDWVRSGEVDLAIVFDAPDVPGVDLQPLLTEELYLVEPPSAECGRDKTVPFSAVSKLPLVLTGSAHGLRKLIERYAEQASMPLTINTELDSLTAIKDVVASGNGSSVLPWPAIRRDHDAGTLTAKRIVNPAIIRQVQLAVSCDWPPTQATTRIAALIRSLMRDLVERDHWRGNLPAR